MEDAVVDKLYKLLHDAFIQELNNLITGHGFDNENLDYMNELVHTIMFLEDPKTKSFDGISILNRYTLFE